MRRERRRDRNGEKMQIEKDRDGKTKRARSTIENVLPRTCSDQEQREPIQGASKEVDCQGITIDKIYRRCRKTSYVRHFVKLNFCAHAMDSLAIHRFFHDSNDMQFD